MMCEGFSFVEMTQSNCSSVWGFVLWQGRRKLIRLLMLKIVQYSGHLYTSSKTQYLEHFSCYQSALTPHDPEYEIQVGTLPACGHMNYKHP